MKKIIINIYNNNNKVKKEFKNYDELINYLYINLGIIKDVEIIDIISNSKYVKICPLYDIYTQNIYLVELENVYDKLINHHYRPINQNIKNIINKSDNKKSINFIKNFNIDILEQTFYKNIYNTSPTTEELTECLRPSFLPFFKSTNPYYSKTELIYLALNKNLQIKDLESTCNVIKENDITSANLLKHQIYIRENSADKYIKYYSFLGSRPFNYYLRFPADNYRDDILEKHINNFRNILINSPSWDKSYYLYRWINNDNYLKFLKIGDFWIDRGFMSTTRQPFVDPSNNYFGFILIKIKIPKDVKGCGLSVEYYSHFPEEQEIIIAPSKYKLVDVQNTKYFHPDPTLENKIISKYEFEWISNLDDLDFIDVKSYKSEKKLISSLNFDTYHLSGYNITENLVTFKNEYSDKFYSKIGKIDVLFYLNNIESGAYDKFFYTNILDKAERYETLDKEIFIIWQNESTGDINLFIEIGSIISVNYYNRFIGNELNLDTNNVSNNDILLFINNLAKLFNIDKIVIHPDYRNFWNIIDKSIFANIDINNIDSFHIKQLYISDCFYFNQLLYLYIDDLNETKIIFSEFTKFLYNNDVIKFTYGKDTLKYLMNINLNEFINDYINEYKHKYNVESYLDLIIKNIHSELENL
jgi:hypothetical protein